MPGQSSGTDFNGTDKAESNKDGGQNSPKRVASPNMPSDRIVEKREFGHQWSPETPEPPIVQSHVQEVPAPNAQNVPIATPEE